MARTAICHHDSPLGRWTRAFYFPDAPLADHVQLFWHVSGRANYMRDRRLPTGNAHLLFNLGAAPTLFAREPGGPSRSFPTCWLAGQSERFIEEHGGKLGNLSVSLRETKSTLPPRRFFLPIARRASMRTRARQSNPTTRRLAAINMAAAASTS